jgi:hypothetical protein
MTRMFGMTKHECFGNRELRRWSLFQLRDLKGQLRKRCLQNVPDEFQIGSRIIVHDAIAQTGYLRPWNRRVSVPEFGGKLLCRLSDYLEIAHHCVDRLFVSDKSRFIQPSGVTLYLFDRGADVVE